MTAIDTGRAFAAANLEQCARELLDWQDTSILVDGKVRELAAILQQLVSTEVALRIAESQVVRAALERVGGKEC